MISSKSQPLFLALVFVCVWAGPSFAQAQNKKISDPKHFIPKRDSREQSVINLGNEINQKLDEGKLGLHELVGNEAPAEDTPDPTFWFIWILISSVIGTAYFVYGKKRAQYQFMVWGALLCILPYFFNQTWMIGLSTGILAGLPFLLKRIGFDF